MTFDFTVNFATIFAMLGFAIAGIAAWYNLRAQVQKNADRIDTQALQLTTANLKVGLALEKADEARAKTASEFSDYRLQVAREYATNNAVALIEERIVAAIERLGDRFDKYFDAPRK